MCYAAAPLRSRVPAWGTAAPGAAPDVWRFHGGAGIRSLASRDFPGVRFVGSGGVTSLGPLAFRYPLEARRNRVKKRGAESQSQRL